MGNRARGSDLRVQDLGVQVQGLGFRVLGVADLAIGGYGAWWRASRQPRGWHSSGLVGGQPEKSREK